MSTNNQVRNQTGIGVWTFLIVAIIILQWIYFAILSVALVTSHRNFHTEIEASVQDKSLHGRFKQDLLNYYLKKAEDLKIDLEEHHIEIVRERGVDKPSTVTLSPRFERDFLFGIRITYQSPITLEIPSLRKGSSK